MINTVAAVFGTFINVLALTWVLDLEKNRCQCVNDWRRKVIKYWYILALIWPLVVIATRPPSKITQAVGIFGLFAFCAMTTSLWDIQHQKCRCAQDWRERILLVTHALSIVGIILSVLK